ncbi:MAG: TetR/AcrR family transcriptional regulator [Flagellimonas sp.]
MKNIKEAILIKAKELFNQNGVANVSIRMIARELEISHSNLLYHFKDKNSILNALHQEILESAVNINTEIKYEESALKSLFISTLKGFEVLVDYRFFMIDFNYILRENQVLHKRILEIETLRQSMYAEKINLMISQKILRNKQYDSEFLDLIKQIRIFSDYWLSSAQVYENNVALSIKKYARLFLLLFYPYLTKHGKAKFDKLLIAYDL